MKYFESKKEEENSYYYEKFIKDLRKNILKELRVDEKEGKDFLRDGNIFELLDIDIEDIVENLNPSISLTESIKGDFYFENKVLYIEKYNLKIDCEKDERINFINNKGADILRELMKNYTVTFGGRELFERSGQ